MSKTVKKLRKYIEEYKQDEGTSFDPFKMLASGLIVNVLMTLYYPKEFYIASIPNKVAGEIHIHPSKDKPHTIYFNITKDKTYVSSKKEDYISNYDRAMRGI